MNDIAPVKTIKLPDPHGMIARIKRKLNPNCALALSPYCETLIAQRMQGVSYQELERWTIKQGLEHRIPAATLCRNFQSAKDAVELPLAEELAEKWGGTFDYSAARSLAGQIMIQRGRVDRMVRAEEAKQKTSPHYFDKRIRGEMETLTVMTTHYNRILKNPMDAAKEMEDENAKAAAAEVELTPEAMEALTGLILAGKIKMGNQ